MLKEEEMPVFGDEVAGETEKMSIGRGRREKSCKLGCTAPRLFGS